MSDRLTDIGGVTSTTCKLIHHFGSQFTSKAKEVLRDGKHVFNFLVIKIICALDICQTFAAYS